MDIANVDQFLRLWQHVTEVPWFAWIIGALVVVPLLPFVVTSSVMLIICVPRILWYTFKATARGVSFGLCKAVAYHRNGTPRMRVLGALLDALSIHPIVFFFDEAMGSLYTSSRTLAGDTMVWTGVFGWHDSTVTPPDKGNWVKWQAEAKARREKHDAMVKEHGPDYDV